MAPIGGRFFVSVEHRCFRAVFAMVTVRATQPAQANQSQPHLPHRILVGHPLRHGSADDRQSSGNWVRLPHDRLQHSSLFGVYCVEEQATMVPENHV